ncbi:MAG: toxin TcdB middle/N-terminal domain-containing protein, partial [Bacteroidales bacterium]
GLLTLMDLDGDGLADKVFKQGNTVYFRKQIAQGERSFTFGNKVALPGLRHFLEESSHTNTWGLQASAGVSYSGGWPKTTSTTSTYFADVNADGLPDLITEGGVLFNTLHNGVPTFTPVSTLTAENSPTEDPSTITIPSTMECGGIIFDGEVNDSIACRIELELDTFYRYKHVLQFADRLIDSLMNKGYECKMDTMSDGEMFINVYRKVVQCDPPVFDPDMDAVRVWVAPKAGTITIHSSMSLLQDTSVGRLQSKYVNGIGYSVQVNRGNYLNAGNTLSSSNVSELFREMILPDDYTVHVKTASVTVAKGDIVFFRLQSNGNRAFDKVNWGQNIQYQNTTRQLDDFGKDANGYHSGADFLVSGNSFFQATENGTIKITGALTTGTLNRNAILYITYNNAYLGIYNVIPNMQQNINISYPVQKNDSIKFIIIGDGTNNTTWSNIHFSPKLEYIAAFPVSSTAFILDTLVYYPPVNFRIKKDTKNTLYNRYYKLFGPLYRCWGQFAYNNNYPGSSITDLIDIGELKIDEILLSSDPADTLAIYSEPDLGDGSQSAACASFDANGMYHPLSTKTRWVEMQPNSEHQAWVGYGNINYVKGSVMTNTRLPELTTVAETSDIVIYDHPVPASSGANPVVKTVRKQNCSSPKNKSFSLGVPIVPISVGASESGGNNTILTDYMDLNGDRYPDVLGQLKVQYSMPWGGIGQMSNFDVKILGISKSATFSDGQTFGASFAMPSRSTGNNPKNSKISFDGQGSVGANIGNGTDVAQYSFMDINGDGLPDQISDMNRVALNMGYRFLDYETWNQGAVREGSSTNTGLNVGPGSFDVGQASIGGGLAINSSENLTGYTLLDINGDGLVDKVTRSGTTLKIQYSLGNGKWTAVETVTLPQISLGTSYSESVNGSVTMGFTFFGFLKVNAGIQASPYNRSFSKDKVQLIDIDGDGYTDYVTSNAENEMRVRYNQSGKTNLLKRVSNFTGSYMELDYQMPVSSYEKPQRSWVMSRVKTKDPYTTGGGDSTMTTFAYRNPHYDRYERMEYGYDTVIIGQYNTENNTLYRSTVQGYANRNFLKRGKKLSETILDGAGKPYIETLYEAQMADLNDGTPVGDGPCPAEAFPILETEIVNYYGGQPTVQLTTAKSWKYDLQRNVILYINYGDTSLSTDDLRAVITYKSGQAHHLISLAESITVTNRQGTVLRTRTALYNALGKPTQMVQHDGENFSTTELEYDTYGNTAKITFPANAQNERMFYQYQYDPVVHTYPIHISNALNEYSTATYDYRFGKPTLTRDMNDNEMQYQYDYLGRTVLIKGPNEVASGAPYTIKMEYVNANNGGVEVMPHLIHVHSYATTLHYDAQHPGNPIRTTLFCDGFGRLLQTKKDAEVGGSEVSLVSGKVVYDCFGRTIKQYHPVQEPLAQVNTLNNSYDPSTLSRSSYDILDRQTKVVLPTGDSTVTSYGFGGGGFSTTTTDAKGNTVVTLTDARGLQTRIEASGSNVTSFVYNALGELTESTDPDGIKTSYSYNMRGQRIGRSHPDAGTDVYQYDAAGNMIAHATQNLQNNGRATQYLYH